MNYKLKHIIIIAGAILLGVFSNFYIVGWYNIIPWIIAALIIGYLSKGRKDTMINGALFGYFLFVAYILSGYNGKTDTVSILKFILFCLAFSLLGAAAGLVGTFIGNFIRSKIIKGISK
jgi:hypothetical protein